MNELQIIQRQLAAERQHFKEITDACCAILDNSIPNRGGQAVDTQLVSACFDYFTYVSRPFESYPRSLIDEKLLALRDELEVFMGLGWRELIELLRREVDRRFAALTAERAGNLRIDEWRTVTGIDADSIMAERAAYTRVKAALSHTSEDL